MPESDYGSIILIGKNIEGSKSPMFHNRLLSKHGLSIKYRLAETTESDLSARISSLRNEKIIGANVTSPFKEIVVPMLDWLDPTAQECNSVNTIVRHKSLLHGFNTDVEGFRHSISTIFQFRRPFSAAVIGTGGAARSVLRGLMDCENLRDVAIVSRTIERAKTASALFPSLGATTKLIGEELCLDENTIVLNATPLGLPGSHESPVLSDHIKGVSLLYDLVYSSTLTPFLSLGETLGIDTVDGTEFFVGQAEAAFKLWTGIEPGR